MPKRPHPIDAKPGHRRMSMVLLIMDRAVVAVLCSAAFWLAVIRGAGVAPGEATALVLGLLSAYLAQITLATGIYTWRPQVKSDEKEGA